MAKFEKINSGLKELDKALDNIRLGDNVVIQVTALPDFRAFCQPFVNQAIKDGRKVVYFRFADHERILTYTKGIEVVPISLSRNFERFTASIYEEIVKRGPNVFYVFDCISDLQRVWATDLMMGNFYKVICPLLFSLDTVSYYPIIRDRHSHDTVDRIRDISQVFLDIFECPGDPDVDSGYGSHSISDYDEENEGNSDNLYMHPIKVWNRYTPNMYMPYVFSKKDSSLRAITDGVELSRYYNLTSDQADDVDEAIADSWDRFFYKARRDYKEGELSPKDISKMTSDMLTHDEKIMSMVQKYFKPKDFFDIRSRMAGTGRIGGKACGMLLARKIIKAKLPQYSAYIEPHDSFFVGADVFYTYIVENGCFPLRLKQHTDEGYFDVDEFREAVKKGEFPENIKESFRRILDHFGHSPVIVRSSSMLEDGFGNAFAGKYESVFCVNSGTPEERLKSFEDAARTVYLSLLDRSALEYRRQRGLDKKHEQMALLVQRVSGSYYGPYFMPCAAGVGYSYSTYRLSPDMDSSVGMLRLVAGLGTRAVNRTERDYPRLVRLDKPESTLYSTDSDRHKFSQRRIDLLDTLEDDLVSKNLNDVIEYLPDSVKNNLLRHDYEAERLFRERGDNKNIFYVAEDGLLKNTIFPVMMRDILRELEEAYGCPVDIEFALNLSADGKSFAVNILQCRSLSVFRAENDEVVILPEDLNPDDIFIHLKEDVMGQSRDEMIHTVVYVDPEKYYNCPYAEKPAVAGIINDVNTYIKENNLNAVLVVPGRIGTSSPELGVPVAFADINYFHAIFEEAYSAAGYRPDLSFGSHMFQDLVEDDMFYGALKENSNRIVFNREILKNYPDISAHFCQKKSDSTADSSAAPSDIVSVYDMKDAPLHFLYDMNSTGVMIFK